MELQGEIIKILPLMEGVSKQGNAWKVQPFVVETQDSFQKKVYFEIYGEDKINQNPIEMGDIVNVLFDIESREFGGRWYTVCRAWKVKDINETQQPESKTNVVRPDAPQQPADTTFDAQQDNDFLF